MIRTRRGIIYVPVQMTPVNLVRHNSVEMQQFAGDCVDDSLSMDTQDVVDQPAFSITEIAVSHVILKIILKMRGYFKLSLINQLTPPALIIYIYDKSASIFFKFHKLF